MIDFEKICVLVGFLNLEEEVESAFNHEDLFGVKAKFLDETISNYYCMSHRTNMSVDVKGNRIEVKGCCSEARSAVTEYAEFTQTRVMMSCLLYVLCKKRKGDYNLVWSALTDSSPEDIIQHRKAVEIAFAESLNHNDLSLKGASEFALSIIKEETEAEEEKAGA